MPCHFDPPAGGEKSKNINIQREQLNLFNLEISQSLRLLRDDIK